MTSRTAANKTLQKPPAVGRRSTALRVSVVIVVLAAMISSAIFRTNAAWRTPVLQMPEQYFLYGSIGAELMPLPVFQVSRTALE